MRFENKVAFVTGGGAGIGFAIAQALAKEGAAIAVADISETVGQKAVARLVADDSVALNVRCDVADRPSVESAVNQVATALGGVDILINCAGLHLPDYVKRVTEMEPDDWRRLLDVNVLGIVNCACACREVMRERGAGVIINVSSMAAYKAENACGISKQAVNGLTVALARDLSQDRIRVVGIAPGLVASVRAMEHFTDDMRRDYVENKQLVHRLGELEDITSAALFLCSDEASFITGETMVVSGGAVTRL